MLDKLKFNNLVLTNAKVIEKVRIQIVRKIIAKMRKLTKTLEKRPGDSANVVKQRKCVAIVEQVKKIKRDEVMRKIFLLEKQPDKIVTNSQSAPEEVAVALFAVNKAMQDLVKRFREALNYNEEEAAAWKKTLVEMGKLKEKKQRRKKRAEKEEKTPKKKVQGKASVGRTEVKDGDKKAKKDGEKSSNPATNSEAESSEESAVESESSEESGMESDSEADEPTNGTEDEQSETTVTNGTTERKGTGNDIAKSVKVRKAETNEKKEPPKFTANEKKGNPKSAPNEKKEKPKPAPIEKKEKPKPAPIEKKEKPKPAQNEKKENPKYTPYEEEEPPKVEMRSKFMSGFAKFNVLHKTMVEAKPKKVIKVADPFFRTVTGEPYMANMIVPDGESEEEYDDSAKQEEPSKKREKKIKPPSRERSRNLPKNFKSNRVEEKPKREEGLHPSWQAKKKKSGIAEFRGKKIKFDGGEEGTQQRPMHRKNNEPEKSDLHPSWAAKQKMKPTIAAFQGKKIKFDDVE